LVALFCALIVIGLAIVAVFVFRPPKAVAESSWTPIEATVTASGLRSETPQNGPGAGKTVYKPVVTYVYEIDGVRHESPLTAVENQPAPEGVWTQRSAEKAFPRGMKIAAWVDPADPSRSALEPVAEESLDKTWFIGAFVFLWVLVPFGVFVLFPAIRKSAGGEDSSDGRGTVGDDSGESAAPPVSEHYASANVRSHKPVLQAGRLLVVPAPAPHLWWTAALMIPAGFALLAVALLTDLPRQWGWDSSAVTGACCFAFCFWVGGGGVLAVAILTLKKGMRAAFDRARDRMTVERRTRFTPGEPLDAPLSELQSVLFRRERRVKTIHHRGAQHVAPMVWDSWGVWLRLRNGYDFFLLENGSRRAQEKIARAIADYARVPLETP
jgi:hypothetical protein